MFASKGEVASQICDADEEFIGRAELGFDEVKRLIEEDGIPNLRNRGCIGPPQLRVLQKATHEGMVSIG
ncbi:hypothetical protein FHS95_000325 [Sphingomonas naasensis]|uniref:Uncharacterized protein n=1 Tax=Sphingomonas naasensis TaxID=1344951 RepID=A0A4S1WWF5_9SPHN|nr:hypothetical protein [Sphingomonas naasensis]NIJ18656.1 hypothetical protein [Sphingomonas naasensis]TGX45896.1 hypothetical protein E5A74_01610 [Sphingomonas naasensis]